MKVKYVKSCLTRGVFILSIRSLVARPTYDFINELCSYHKGIEVLEPQDSREKIRDYLVETLSRY